MPKKSEQTRETDSLKQEKNVFEELTGSMGRLASKTVDSIKHTIDRSLSSRNTVMTIRVNEEANEKLNMLVEAGIFKSRSESAAFLIEEGIKHQQELFGKIQEKLKKISKIREELKDIVSHDIIKG